MFHVHAKQTCLILFFLHFQALPQTAFVPKLPEQQPDNHFCLEVQHPDQIFYNRVPKCGSRTVRLLVAKPLAATLGIHFESSKIYDDYNMDETEQVSI